MMRCHPLPVSCFSLSRAAGRVYFHANGPVLKTCSVFVCLFVEEEEPLQLFVPHFAALRKDDLVLLGSSHCLSIKRFSLHALFAAVFSRLLLTYVVFFSSSFFLMGETDVYSHRSSADCSTKPVPAVLLWS